MTGARVASRSAGRNIFFGWVSPSWGVADDGLGQRLRRLRGLLRLRVLLLLRRLLPLGHAAAAAAAAALAARRARLRVRVRRRQRRRRAGTAHEALVALLVAGSRLGGCA